MRLTQKAQAFVAAKLQDGDVAIDATAGNGHDTLFLTQQVGANGHVLAFDIQSAALSATNSRLRAAKLHQRVSLIHDSHANLAGHIVQGKRRLMAVMFNLGYLPGADKAITTQVRSTLAAIESALSALAIGGRCTVAAYRGHAGGQQESDAVAKILCHLGENFRVNKCTAPGNGPVLWLVEKLADINAGDTEADDP